MKNIVITGAASGIGLSSVNLFKDAGWRVLGSDIQNKPIDFMGDFFCRADLSIQEGIEKLVAFCQQLNSIDALVNNAAIQICKPLEETRLSDIDAVFNTNFKAPLLLTCRLRPLLQKKSGSVVHICSVHSLVTSNNIGIYAASKAALMSLTRTMSMEFAGYGIRVNSILPGAVKTAMLEEGVNRFVGNKTETKFFLKKMEKKIPLERIGEPDEIAKAILFLADNNQSSYITGQGIVVDGGCLAQLSSE